MLSNKVSQSNTGIQQPLSSTVSSSTLNSSTSVNATAGLEKGQIVRGEVIDLRSDKVSVKLEDGRMLSGKLEETANLAIGDKVAFRVEDVSLKSLTLKIIANAQYLVEDNTIDKAMEAAGLGKNSRNRAIISELLNQQMSIDKKTISLLIQQSIMNKDSSINSLVLMNKYHIPVTEANVSLFESYRNSEHSMMKEIGNLADSIPNLFAPDNDGTYSEYLTQSKGLLSLVLNDKMSDSFAAKTLNTATTQDTVLTQNTVVSQDNNNIITTGSLLSQKGSISLAQTYETAATSAQLFSSNLYNNILNGTADIIEVAHIFNQILDGVPLTAPRLNEEIQKGALVSTSIEKATVSSATVSPTAVSSATDTYSQVPSTQSIISSIENSTATQTILAAYQEEQYNNNELGSFLQSFERTNLLQSLESFSLPKEIQDQITSGDISPHKLLRLIQEGLGSASESAVKNLFESKEYKNLLKEELLSKWEFTPKSLTKEGEIDKHFESLSNQLNELKEYMDQTSKSSNSSVAGQANHLQENINFMKSLNEFFTYVQIPLKLKNQNAHSELFVYTKKKEGRTAADGISVLLHLDMEHLGPLDIHIDLHNKNVVGKFYLNHEDTIKLISSHLPVLEQSLIQKGYTLNTEILRRDKGLDIVEDFMKQDTKASSVTRYNFDIRA